MGFYKMSIELIFLMSLDNNREIYDNLSLIS